MKQDLSELSQYLKQKHRSMVDEASHYTQSTIDLLHCDAKFEDWRVSSLAVRDILTCGSDLIELGISCKKRCRIPMLALFCAVAPSLNFVSTLDATKTQFAYKKDDDGEWVAAPVPPVTPLVFIFKSWSRYLDPERN